MEFSLNSLPKLTPLSGAPWLCASLYRLLARNGLFCVQILPMFGDLAGIRPELSQRYVHMITALRSCRIHQTECRETQPET